MRENDFLVVLPLPGKALLANDSSVEMRYAAFTGRL
jgi:hypothetical protein